MSSLQASPELAGTGTGRFTRPDATLIAVLVLATLAIYIRVWNFDFIAYDDQLYVYANVHVIQGATLNSLRWARTAEPNGNWHPLTTVTQLVISSLFGIRPRAYHLVNVVLQAVNVALLYLFLRRATGRKWPAFFTALLWCVHPLRVESVAWVSELKDVLCGTFWLGCMLAYLSYSRRRTLAGYTLVLLLDGLSLLGKPMAVTLPLSLLLLDCWPLAKEPKSDGNAIRWWSLRVIEKVPLLAFSVLDILRQKNKVRFTSPGLSFELRAENALVSYALYLRDTFFPYHLGIFYPHPAMLRHVGQTVHIPLLEVAGSAAVLLTVSALVLWRARAQPYLLVGWCWFLGTLVPVIGLTQVGEQARADRFTYLPSIGLFLAMVWLVDDVTRSRPARHRTMAVTGGVIAMVLGLLSGHYLGFWKNTQSLFGHLLQIQPDNYLALSSEADRLVDAGRDQQATDLGKRAVEVSPGSPRCRDAYGNALRASGQLEKAAEQYQIATALDPEEAASWAGLGRVRDSQANRLATAHNPGEPDLRRRAIADFKNAIIADPDDPNSYEYLAFQLALLGRLDEAVAVWEQVLDMDPSYAQAQGDLADALRLKNDLPGAVEHYRAALAAGSKNPTWESELSYLMATNPLAAPADVMPMVAVAKDAVDQTNGRAAAAQDAYAACLARTNQFELAINAAQQGVADANAAHQPAVAAAIRRRLALYEKYQPYVARAAEPGPATVPTTSTAE